MDKFDNDINYCSKCGRKMIRVEEDAEKYLDDSPYFPEPYPAYDSCTGKKMKITVLKCPRYSAWRCDHSFYKGLPH